MMKGKYEKICDLICKKVSALSASDPGDDSAKKCYHCKGRQGSTNRQGPTRPVRHKVEPKIYILDGLAKLEEFCLQKLFSNEFFWN